MLPQALLHHGTPWHQTEAHAVVEHREAATGKLNRTPVDATGIATVAQWAVS
jgi:hypothetical protein